MSVRRGNVVGAALLFVGGVAWAWVVRLGEAVRAVEPAILARSRTPADPTVDELPLEALDLRIAPLLIVLCGVAVLAAPALRRASSAVAVVGFTFVALLLGAGLLGRLAEAGVAQAAVATAGLWATAATLVIAARALTPRSGGDGGHLVRVAFVPVATVPLLEAFVPSRPWVAGLLPDGYLLAIPVLEVLLLVTGFAVVVSAQGRVTPALLGGGAVSAAALSALLFTTVQSRGAALITAGLGGVLIASVCLVALAGRPRAAVVAAAASVPAYMAFFIPAVLMGLPLGLIAVAAADGTVGADGLPLLAGGAVAALAGVAACEIAAHVPARAADHPQPPLVT